MNITPTSRMNSEQLTAVDSLRKSVKLDAFYFLFRKQRQLDSMMKFKEISPNDYYSLTVLRNTLVFEKPQKMFF